jgi:hypothetical protein
MLRALVPLLLLSTLAFATLSSAADVRQQPRECSRIEDSVKRVACFDALAADKGVALDWDFAFAMLPVIIIVTTASYSLGERLSGVAGSVYHWIGMVGIGIVIALCAYAALRPA